MFYSPLRYPGGKNKLAAFIAKICIDNNINGHYIEPYSGGASVALYLLLEGFVKKITINDKDRSIYAFWYSVLNNTTLFCERIRDVEISIEEWRKQKSIQTNKETVNLFDLGFSTFFLNRTNRSGIINGGPIGGIEQNGNYKIDCRFNKNDLIDRIRVIASRKKDIRLYKKDAIKLIQQIQEESNNSNAIFYFDPPYFLKASSLYLNHYKHDDHKAVSDSIKNIKNIKWLISYDNVPEIINLYSECQMKEFSFKHTAYKVRTGKEVLFFSNKIKQPDIANYNPLKFKLDKEKNTANIVYSAFGG
ncbi:MAG: DNA adenine methylase [Candidatus Pacebacteria bacterium]|nr:DNA adenine methylase [Candidatus Paceibacterota bacterium]